MAESYLKKEPTKDIITPRSTRFEFDVFGSMEKLRNIAATLAFLLGLTMLMIGLYQEEIQALADLIRFYARP